MADRKKIGTENREWGQFAESLAAEYFLKKGYVIRERNWKLGHLEVDLILETGRTIVFVEVKARANDNLEAIEAVDRKKRQRIINAADTYLQYLPHRYEYRFDIVTFTGTADNHVMHHYEDAFLPPVNGGR